METKIYVEPSATIKGKEYRVRYSKEHGWQCGCLGFVTHSKKIGYCRHILNIIETEIND